MVAGSGSRSAYARGRRPFGAVPGEFLLALALGFALCGAGRREEVLDGVDEAGEAGARCCFCWRRRSSVSSRWMASNRSSFACVSRSSASRSCFISSVCDSMSRRRQDVALLFGPPERLHQVNRTDLAEVPSTGSMW